MSEGKRVRVLVGKPELDGSDRTAHEMATALRDAGMEVIFTDQRATSLGLATAAAQEDVDVIALSISSGQHLKICGQLRADLIARGANLPLLLCGPIDDADVSDLETLGVKAVLPASVSSDALVRTISALADGASAAELAAHGKRSQEANAYICATRLDHTALCVKDLDATIALLEELFGQKCAHRETVASQKVDAAFFDFPNGASLELVSPAASLGGNAGLEKFLGKRGDGLHHLALRVEDLDALLQKLAAKGVPLIDTVSRAGARGHKVAFLHPKALNGTLLELVEAHG